MAVLTYIGREDAEALLVAYALGPLRRVEEIAGGSVNSNFALECGGGRLFLRLYEERDLAAARRETAMLTRLGERGVPTPMPLQRTDGQTVSVVRGKPAALFPWRPGVIRCQAGVTAADARRVGEALAQVHVAGAGESAEQGRFGFPELVVRLDRIAASGDARFVPRIPDLRDRLERARAARDPGLPRGLTHGDLFRDNVLWDAGGEIAALLDFESACEDSYAYDLAVTLLAWCVGDGLEPHLLAAMCDGYRRVRPLATAEVRGLHAEALFASLRFTLTRITDYAMREGTASGARSVKDWRRFDRRYEALQGLGEAGFRAMLGI